MSAPTVCSASRLDDFLAGQDDAACVVVGVDLSLTSTGLAGVGFDFDGRVAVETGRIATKLRGHDRLEELLSSVVRAGLAADLVVIEGLAFAAHDTARAGAGLSWLVRHELWRNNISVALVPPSVRALYATGKGNAGKDAVLAATINRYGPLTTIDQNDVADAFVLAAMGCRHLGRSLEVDLPQRQVDAVAKAEWPARAGATS